MNIRRRRAGSTLIELMVYMFLLGLLLYAVYGIFVASLRYFQTAQATVDLQESAQKVIIRMILDIADTDYSTVVITGGSASSGTGIIFASPRSGVDLYIQDTNASDGQLVGLLYWQKWICIYFDSTSGTVYRSTIGITPTATTPTNTYTDTSAFSGLSGNKRLATNCTSFTVSKYNASPDPPGNWIKVAAGFQQSVFSNAGGTNDNQINITDEMMPRN